MMRRSRAEDDVEVGSHSKKVRGGGGSVSSSFEKQLTYIESVKRADRSGLYPKFALLLQDFKARRVDVTSLTLEIKKLFAGNRNLILGFNLFLPDWCKISLDDEEDDEKTESEPETDEDDDEEEEKEDGKFKSGKFESHHATLPVHKGCYYDPEKEIKTRLYKQGFNICNKVEQGLCSSDYQVFLKHLYNYSIEKITRDDLRAAVTDILGSDRNIDRNLVEEFMSFINAPEEHLSKLWEFEEEKKEQKQIKSVYQLDLSECKRISPSYWLLPKANRVSLSTQISENDQVLNDKLVCSSLRGESYSFKHRQIQEREEIQFRCEDDRYEMDMLMEYIRSAIEKVKKLLNAIEEKKVNLETGMKIKDHLNIFNRRCIERLYGEYGLEMMDVMQEKPNKALPVILKRLEQKEQELSKFRDDFNKLSAHTHAKSFSKKSSRECSVEERDHMMQQTVNDQALALQGALAGE